MNINAWAVGNIPEFYLSRLSFNTFKGHRHIESVNCMKKWKGRYFCDESDHTHLCCITSFWWFFNIFHVCFRFLMSSCWPMFSAYRMGSTVRTEVTQSAQAKAMPQMLKPRREGVNKDRLMPCKLHLAKMPWLELKGTLIYIIYLLLKMIVFSGFSIFGAPFFSHQLRSLEKFGDIINRLWEGYTQGTGRGFTVLRRVHPLWSWAPGCYDQSELPRLS